MLRSWKLDEPHAPLRRASSSLHTSSETLRIMDTMKETARATNAQNRTTKNSTIVTVKMANSKDTIAPFMEHLRTVDRFINSITFAYIKLTQETTARKEFLLKVKKPERTAPSSRSIRQGINVQVAAATTLFRPFPFLTSAYIV